MILVIKIKDTDNIIGVKEDIASRLEAIADVERIDVYTNEEYKGGVSREKDKQTYKYTSTC
jgi:hypothetical protein